MPNPRPRGLSPKSRTRRPYGGLTLGLDLGATKVRAVLVDRTGRVIRSSGRLAHSNDGPANVIKAVVRAARRCLPEGGDALRGAGIAVAAQVDPATGRVRHAPNLRWKNVPLGRILTHELGVQVRVFNDARAATYAEWTRGAGVGCEDLFCLVVGTGVGGSAVVGGRLLEGGTHAAGEVGHLPIVSGGRRCHCPGRGCFEAYVGGWAIAERAREAVRADPRAGRALLLKARGMPGIRAETVFETADAGDPLARRLVTETERYLGDGAVGVVNAFNPSLLILAGGVITGRPELVRGVARAVKQRCQPPAAGVRVVRARFGELAPALGAAALASRPARSAWS
ncbi:MAG: ROK family protein [Thermoplasmata archaeon]